MILFQTNCTKLNLDFYAKVINIAAEERRVITKKQYTFVDSALLVGSVSDASLVGIATYEGFSSPVLLLDVGVGAGGSILITGG